MQKKYNKKFSKYVQAINYSNFKKHYSVKEIDLVANGFFTEKDYKNLAASGNIINALPNLFLHPLNTLKNNKSLVIGAVNKMKLDKKTKDKPLKEKYPLIDYINKVSIITAFKPKTFLEIGTFTGWGVSAVKTANPKCECYTMSPKDTTHANNPVYENRIGIIYKKKKLKVHQIYADSMRYDYKKLPQIDVTYIDGNHEYKWVKSDLEKTNTVTRKMIILDDYVPSNDAPRGYISRYGNWHKDVVRAVEEFLGANNKDIKKAYWIEGTPICVIIKK